MDGPMLRVVRGEPTAEELAALLVVLTARAATAPTLARPGSAWADPAGGLRRPLSPGTGAWRRSALPG
jgi:Acyl-CoA carboxylase epsilon subunit